ncbi:unnamed protein product, partial [Prorocentrum cordatum]
PSRPGADGGYPAPPPPRRLGAPAQPPPGSPPGSAGELLALRAENARLLQRQLSLEQQLRELRPGLWRQCEEEAALGVARRAREVAACVSRHEEQLQRVSQRYEHELAAARTSAAAPATPRSARLPPVGSEGLCAEPQTPRVSWHAAEAEVHKRQRRERRREERRAVEGRAGRERVRLAATSAVALVVAGSGGAVSVLGRLALAHWRTFARARLAIASAAVLAGRRGAASLAFGQMVLARWRAFAQVRLAVACAVAVACSGGAADAALAPLVLSRWRALLPRGREAGLARALRRSAGGQALLALAAPLAAWCREARRASSLE